MQRNVHSLGSAAGRVLRCPVGGRQCGLLGFAVAAAQPSNPVVAPAQSELPSAALGAVASVLGAAAAPASQTQRRGAQNNSIWWAWWRVATGVARPSSPSTSCRPKRSGSAATVTDEWVLHAVGPRQATLARGADRKQTHTLDMPAPGATN